MSAQAPAAPAQPAPAGEIIYPESDGKPIADNTKQFRWIVTIEGGLEALFRNDPNVFVAGDLLWYPVEGRPDICTAPDALVAFGRPKGDRPSYLQWKEEGIPPQVVFEVLSPGNTAAELRRKLEFYDRYGVEEYYIYDPDRGRLSGWLRGGNARLEAIDSMQGWVSPRLGVRFELEAGDLHLYRPDGERFASYVDLIAQREQERQRAEQERQLAAEERQRADQERRRAEQERRHAADERQRADEERERAERLAARLRALGVDPADV
jgi:Uma2 family endonuclease